MLRHNLPALIVVVPLLGGILTPILFRRGARPWAWATFVVASTFALSVALLLQVRGVLPAWSAYPSYPMGSWPIPWGIELRLDPLGAFVLVIISLVATVVTFAARRSLEREIPEDRRHFFYAVWILCITGFLGITITGDAFNVYVLLETASLASYILVGMGRDRDRRALKASVNYLLLGSIGACLILLGIGYIYMVTGTLNMADMAARLGEIRAKWEGGEMIYRRTVMVAVAFFAVGIGLKLALFPLHAWLPDAYTYAPSMASALLAGISTKVGAYVAMRFFFTVLGPEVSFRPIPTGTILQWCAAAGIVYGSLMALRQTEVKRILAYSSVAQVGYIALGIGIATPTGLQGSIVHLLNHAITKSGLFVALAAVALQAKGTTLVDLRGLGRRMPVTMAAFTAGGLGLIGIPMTAGFVSKWYLVKASIEQGLILPVVAVVVGSLLALAYVWRVVEAVYQPSADPGVREAPWSVVVSTWILIGASLFFGLHATLTSRLSLEAAHALLRGGP